MANDVKDTTAPPDQRFSVRGTGTVVGVATDQDGAPIYDRTGRQVREVWNEGRYQDAFDMLLNFGKIGTVLQASQIPHLPKGTPSDWFLEVQSKLTGPEDEAQAWPNPTVPPSAVKDAELS